MDRSPWRRRLRSRSTLSRCASPSSSALRWRAPRTDWVLRRSSSPMRRSRSGHQKSRLELVSAYAPFANGGNAVDTHVVQRVRTRWQGVVCAPLAKSRPHHRCPLRGHDERDAERDAHKRDRPEGAASGWPAAGKTGTSQDFRDAWFIGYTSHLVTGVWLGNDDSSPGRKATGGGLPVEIWSRVMKAAHQGVAVAALPALRAGCLPRRPRRRPACLFRRQQSAARAMAPRAVIMALMVGSSTGCSDGGEICARCGRVGKIASQASPQALRFTAILPTRSNVGRARVGTAREIWYPRNIGGGAPLPTLPNHGVVRSAGAS
jgi:hypothetical protein